MRHRVHQEIFFISCLLLVFFLPVFPKIVPSIIFIMIVNWLISGVYISTFPRIFSEKNRLFTISFASLYLLYLAGMLYSTDYAYGWFDLEVKLSLLIFPIIFATSEPGVFNVSRTRYLFGAYIGGCIAGSLMLLGHSWIANERWGVPDPYYYSNLAWFFHCSYLAMYYTFGLGIALWYMPAHFQRQNLFRVIVLSAIIIYLEAMIFLLSSKAGLMMMVVTELLFILLLIRRRVPVLKIILVFALMAGLFTVYLNTFPYAFKRISKADKMITTTHSLQSDPTDGNVMRLAIWKVSVKIIKEHFFFGVGTGDVKDALIKAYHQNNLSPLFRKKLNAHNQYFQTFITLGLAGFSLFVMTLLVPAYRSFRNKDYLYLLFILTFAVNILFESMLETQAGVVWYAFFNIFLFSVNSEQ